MILVSTIMFSCMPDIMVWPDIILDIALWVKSMMASLSARLTYKLTTFSTEWTQKHNFGVHNRVFRYARHSGVGLKCLRYCIVGKIQDGRHL